jgi:hypothetical protein
MMDTITKGLSKSLSSLFDFNAKETTIFQKRIDQITKNGWISKVAPQEASELETKSEIDLKPEFSDIEIINDKDRKLSGVLFSFDKEFVIDGIIVAIYRYKKYVYSTVLTRYVLRF